MGLDLNGFRGPAGAPHTYTEEKESLGSHMTSSTRYRGVISVSINDFGGNQELLEIHATPCGPIEGLGDDLTVAGIGGRGPIADAVTAHGVYAEVPECGVKPFICSLVGLGWTVVHDGGLN